MINNMPSLTGGGGTCPEATNNGSIGQQSPVGLGQMQSSPMSVGHHHANSVGLNPLQSPSGGMNQLHHSPGGGLGSVPQSHSALASSVPNPASKQQHHADVGGEDSVSVDSCSGRLNAMDHATSISDSVQQQCGLSQGGQQRSGGGLNPPDGPTAAESEEILDFLKDFGENFGKCILTNVCKKLLSKICVFAHSIFRCEAISAAINLAGHPSGRIYVPIYVI